jgi:hypothetical protein
VILCNRRSTSLGSASRVEERKYGDVIVPVARTHLIDGLDHIDFAVIDGDIGRRQGFTGAFDVSISINVFEQLLNLPRALSVVERILIPRGYHIPQLLTWGSRIRSDLALASRPLVSRSAPEIS